MLKELFITLAHHYSNDTVLVERSWRQIEKAYNQRKRYYHNLQHLEDLFVQLEPVSADIRNRDIVLFALFYHDIVYNTLRQDNEEKSAILAVDKLGQLGLSQHDILQCSDMILATKKHALSPDSDTNYFTDADLSILGRDWADYELYYKKVRKEYGIYPDLVYKPGRKKVLQHFLQKDRIFKTDFFHSNYETQARYNLQREYDSL